jgi:hypothetical protein
MPRSVTTHLFVGLDLDINSMVRHVHKAAEQAGLFKAP